MSLAAAGVPIQFSASIDVNNFFVPVLEGITLESLSSNFPLTAFKIKTVPQKAFLFNITGSISGFNVASSGATSLSGSVQLIKRSGTDTILEEGIFIKQLADTIEGGSGQFNFSTTSSLAFNDLVYLKIIGLGNGSTPRNPSAFTASLNSFKITSEPTGSSKELVVEPYLTSPFYGTNCDVTYGNASQPVTNQFLQDIDYGDGVITPVNNEAIINNTATKGTVPESFFTVKSILNPTYESVNTVSEYNKEESAFTTKDNFNLPINIGTYGQTPSVTLNQSLVAYCDWIGGTTPELNNKVAAHIKYLINENGDAISPNLSPTTVKDVQNNFTKGKSIEVSLIDPTAGSGMQVLNGNKEILKGGYRVEPVLYSQIPNSPFSSSITLETSSLIPVTDVRNSAIRNLSQTATAGASNTLICTTELFDFVSSYEPTTGVYTVQSATVESGVDLIFRTQLVLSAPGTAGGLMDIRIENITTGELVVQENRTHFGSGHSPVEYQFDISGTVLNNKLVAGHVYKVLVDLSNFGPTSGTISSGATFETSQIPSATTDALITGSMWEFSASRQDVLTSTNNTLNQSYNFLKQEPIPNSGFNNTQFLFTIEPGDQFRFQNDESKTYNVINVITPDQEPEGKIKIFLDRNISTSVNKDYFLIRRFVDDGSYIIFDENKPAGASGAAFIKPRFVTNILDKDVDQFIQDLKSKNLLT
jgi:hypothetical protein